MPDPLHRCYSMGVQLTRSGALHVLIGRLNIHTRRYTFVQVADGPFTWQLTTSTDRLFELGAQLVANDSEARLL